MSLTKFIQQYGIQGLKDQFNIEVRSYPDDLHCLNYSQFESPKHHPIVDQCRGVIVDSLGNIYCRPFDRFYNYGEGDTKEFDFSNCLVQEKADGSLVKLWYNPKKVQWEIATRGTAFAEPMHVFGTKTDWTFREAILDAMNLTEIQFQEAVKHLNLNYTVLMEYCSPYNRIVTPYDFPHVVLLSVRDKETGDELLEDELLQILQQLKANGMNVRMPQKYEANSAKQLVDLVDSLPNLQEGVVVRNLNTNQRVKIKNSLYVKVHAVRGDSGVPSKSNLMEMVLTGEKDEFLTYFPEYAKLFEPVDAALSYLLNTAKDLYEKNKHHEQQKDFALAVKDSFVSSILFKARKEKASTNEAFENMTLQQQMNLLDVALDFYNLGIAVN